MVGGKGEKVVVCMNGWNDRRVGGIYGWEWTVRVCEREAKAAASGMS